MHPRLFNPYSLIDFLQKSPCARLLNPTRLLGTQEYADFKMV